MNADIATVHLARSRRALADALAHANAEAAHDRGPAGAVPNPITAAAVATLSALAEAALRRLSPAVNQGSPSTSSGPAWSGLGGVGVRAVLGTADAVLRPLAKQHPWALMAAGTLAGAALATGRPWRWLFPPTLQRSLVLQLAAAAATAVFQRIPDKPDRTA